MEDLKVLQELHDKYIAMYKDADAKYREDDSKWWYEETRDNCEKVVEGLWTAIVYIEALDL